MPEAAARVQYTRFRFLDFLRSIHAPVRVPDWLRTRLGMEVCDSARLAVAAIELSVSARRRLVQLQDCVGPRQVVKRLSDPGSAESYLSYQAAAANDRTERSRSRRHSLELAGLRAAFATWSELHHLAALDRFNYRGAHLMWVYLLAGSNEAHRYLDALFEHERTNFTL